MVLKTYVEVVRGLLSNTGFSMMMEPGAGRSWGIPSSAGDSEWDWPKKTPLKIYHTAFDSKIKSRTYFILIWVFHSETTAENLSLIAHLFTFKKIHFLQWRSKKMHEIKRYKTDLSCLPEFHSKTQDFFQLLFLSHQNVNPRTKTSKVWWQGVISMCLLPKNKWIIYIGCWLQGLPHHLLRSSLHLPPSDWHCRSWLPASPQHCWSGRPSQARC